MIRQAIIVLLAAALPFAAEFSTTAKAAGTKTAEIEIKTVKAPSGNEYTIFYQGPLAASFEVNRPKSTDNSIWLCIPCAFTSYVGSVDGVYICEGRLHHKHFVADNFGGAAIIQNGAIELISTNKGKVLTNKFLNDLVKKKASLFQQFLIVENSIPAHFKDKTLFQRRAIAKMKDGQTAMFESKTPITLTAFGQDLKSSGVVDALYTDMGAYDEGWYRDSDKQVKPIGLDKSLTSKQTNWLTWRERSEK